MREDFIKMSKDELMVALEKIKEITPMILDGTISPYEISRFKDKEKYDYKYNVETRRFIEERLNEVSLWK